VQREEKRDKSDCWGMILVLIESIAFENNLKLTNLHLTYLFPGMKSNAFGNQDHGHVVVIDSGETDQNGKWKAMQTKARRENQI
jgi:hypothetical protein